MLSYLRIRGLALLDDVSLEFSNGLNVLTGETGAGKSIIVDALALLRGARPRGDMVRSGDDSARVDAQLEVSAPLYAELAGWLAERGVAVDPQPTLVLQRVVPRTGKGRAFVEAQLTTRATLAAIGERLVDICSQHEYHSLAQVSGHIELLDRFAELEPDLDAYVALYRAYRRSSAALEESRRRLADAPQKADYLRFQLEELERLNPEPGEYDRLVRQTELLRSAHSWAEFACQVKEQVNESDGCIVEILGTLIERGRRGIEQSPQLQVVVDELNVARAACEDAVQTIRRFERELDVDPGLLESAEARLDELARLRRKHAVTGDDLAQLRDSLRAELDRIENLEDELVKLQDEVDHLRAEAIEKARRLHEVRCNVRGQLAQDLESELHALHMPDARLEARVDLLSDDHLAPTGLDRVEFMFSANSGEPLAPLSRVASGGELSRVLLALKGTLAAGDRVATYVFDEVDSGVGGAVAEAIGHRLSRAAQHHQVLCITHLPQIAAFADSHFRVDKRTKGGRTVTRVVRLTDEQRIDELSRMLGGSRITGTAREHARQLLAEAKRPQRPKRKGSPRRSRSTS